MFDRSKYPAVLALILVVLLLALPEVGAAQEECTGVVTVEGDLAVGVFDVPSTQGPPMFALRDGDAVTVVNRLGNWLLVEYDDLTGYMLAEAVSVPASCTFAGDEWPSWLNTFVAVAITVLGSGPLGFVVTYLAQITKLIAQWVGLPEGQGGKIAMIWGVIAVAVVMGANALGVQDMVAAKLQPAVMILGAVFTILSAFGVYEVLKRAGAMPGAK